MVLFTFFFVLYCISPICQERLVIFNNPSLGSALDCRGQGPGTLREADPETQVTTMQGGQQAQPEGWSEGPEAAGKGVPRR